MKLLLAMPVLLLASCPPEFAAPPPEQPRDCEELARTIRDPQYKDDEDFRVIAKLYQQRLDSANWHLRATAKCQKDVRESR